MKRSYPLHVAAVVLLHVGRCVPQELAARRRTPSVGNQQVMALLEFVDAVARMMVDETHYRRVDVEELVAGSHRNWTLRLICN